MRHELEIMIEELEREPGKTPFNRVANLLDEFEPDLKDWEKLFPLLRKHYNFKTDEEVYQALVKKSEYVDDFLPIVRKHKIEGFIKEYITHTGGMEPPTAYHFGVALVLIGACLQRQIYVPRGYFKIWPAIHVFLVGPSADGKTTAGDYGYKLLQQTGRTTPVIGESKAYIHSLLHGIQEQTGNAVGMIYSPEMADFVGEDDWKKNLVAYLIRLMDGEDNIPSGALSRRDQNLENVAVTVLACSNIELLDRAMPKIATGSGFMSRFFVFHCEGTDRVCPNPYIPDNAASWDWLKECLLKTKEIAGEMHLDPEAEIFYDRWYNLKYRKTFPKDDDLVPFHKRSRNFIIKLAMLFSVSEEISTPVELQPPGEYKNGLPVRYIRKKHLEQADAVMDWIKSKIPKLYDLLGNSPYGKEQNQILNILRKHPTGISKAELSRKLKFPQKKLTDHLNTLYNDGRAGCNPDGIVYIRNLREEVERGG